MSEGDLTRGLRFRSRPVELVSFLPKHMKKQATLL